MLAGAPDRLALRGRAALRRLRLIPDWLARPLAGQVQHRQHDGQRRADAEVGILEPRPPRPPARRGRSRSGRAPAACAGPSRTRSTSRARSARARSTPPPASAASTANASVATTITPSRRTPAGTQTPCSRLNACRKAAHQVVRRSWNGRGQVQVPALAQGSRPRQQRCRCAPTGTPRRRPGRPARSRPWRRWQAVRPIVAAAGGHVAGSAVAGQRHDRQRRDQEQGIRADEPGQAGQQRRPPPAAASRGVPGRDREGEEQPSA